MGIKPECCLYLGKNWEREVVIERQKARFAAEVDGTEQKHSTCAFLYHCALFSSYLKRGLTFYSLIMPTFANVCVSPYLG